MRGLGSLSRAMVKGYVRDRAALFFTMLFPLMFLVLFGGLFKNQGTARVEVLQVGPVALLDQIPADARVEIDRVLDVHRTGAATDGTAADGAAAADARRRVRAGDYAAAISQRGDEIVVDYSVADTVRAATVRSVMQSLVQEANLAATGVPPSLRLDLRQVEDRSLKTIQYITPGLLGWAIATGATFAAAATLVTWREKKILRRLRLAPVRTPAVVLARVGVSLGVALAQMAIFLGVASLPYFGLRLSHSWWLSIPVVLVGTLAFLSIGLLAGALAKTQEAANVMVNLVVLPMAFLSGSFFPLDDAPGWLRTLAQVFPLRHLNTAMLDVMVRGKGVSSVLPEVGVLAAFAVVLSLIAVRVFRWDDV